MRISVLITNCNYGQYVCEAIQSALDQTAQPDEIIIVDDGSTDDSIQRIEAAFSENNLVRLLKQDNGGHITAFNTAIQHSTGDIIFFLDADDYYAPNHIEGCLNVFKQEPKVDFVFTAYQYTGDQTGHVFRFEKSGSKGIAPVAAYFGRHWAGGQTSTLSVRKRLAEKIFPYPKAWASFTKGHGEVGLVHGSSILGAHKYYLKAPTVYYRSHGKNDDQQIRSACSSYNIELLTFSVIQHYWDQAGLSPLLHYKALSEFRTIEHPSKEELKVYRKLILSSPQPLLKRLEQVISAWKHYKKRQNA